MRTVALVLPLLAGCLPYNVVRDPAPPIELPEAYANAEGSETRVEENAWWRDFGDPALASAIDRLLAENLQLHAAFARLQQAQAVADISGAPLWPSVSFEARGGRQRQVIGNFGAQEFNSYSLSLPVSYEVDLFGRLGAEAQASALDALSARDDVEALAMTLVAQTVENY
ncbi:MAG: TolC family protein, partial [Myxococcota bacterium]